MAESRPDFSRALTLSALAAAPAVLLLAAVAPWPWLAPFLGRFHPAVLHLPIALLLLAALLEALQLAGRGRWKFPVTLIWFLGTAGAVTAAALGWLLMRADGVEGALATRHLQGGVATAALGLTTLFVLIIERPSVRWPARLLILTTCAILLRTSHDGGSLTHGETFLDEFAPWKKPAVRTAFAFPKNKPVGEWELYAQVVTPILEARCYECHAAKVRKGKLALDTRAALERGGDSGPLWLPGQPAEKSFLLSRMNLPADHADHMPPRRKPQPTPEEIALVRKWLALGAPAQGTLATLGLDTRLLATAARLPDLLNTASTAEIDSAHTELTPAAIAQLRAPLAATVAQLQARYPAVLAYESRQSADLQFNASLLGSTFADADLAAFAPLRAHLVWVDLSGTAVTDRAAMTLATFAQLRILRLGSTAISDATITALAPLPRLESLSLFHTAITPAALPTLAQFPKLRQVTVASTRITPTTPTPATLAGKIIFGVAPVIFPQIGAPVRN